ELEKLTAETEAEVGQIEQTRQQLDSRCTELDQRAEQVAAKAESLQSGMRELEEGKMSLASQRQAVASERLLWGGERQAALEQDRQTRAAFAAEREGTQDIISQLGQLELRASAALERLSRARERLREHLAEVHGYARQSRDDLETARRQVQADVD